MNPEMTPVVRPSFQLASPMPEEALPAAPVPMQRLLNCLLRFWWLPVLTLLLGLGAASALVWWEVPTFTSKARMWETGKMRLPEGALFAEDAQNFVGTQTELLQSGTMRELALARLRATSNGVVIPVDNHGEPLPVEVRVMQSSKSSVFQLEATGSNPAYTRAYLDALMNVYLEYKKNVRRVVSGDTLASITEQVQRTERDLKAEQDALMQFERTNNMALLQEEGTVNSGYLATLKTKLSDLQLERRFLDAVASGQAQLGGTATNATPDWAPALADPGSASAGSAPSETSKELELLKLQYAKLSKNLRPKHPKMAKLNADIERSEKLLDLVRRQNREQLVAARQANQAKIDNVVSSIKEWETKVVEANVRIAEAQRLKLNVQRIQQVYDRLSMLVQNVGISRNIDQETLSILEPAGPATRSHQAGITKLTSGAAGGLALGLGIILLLVLRDDRFSSMTEVHQKLGPIIVGQVPEVQKLKTEIAPPLLESNDKRYAYAESFRSLRSALLYMTRENERPRVVLITSALPNEGKSTVAANLARTLALGGARVVLVDGDMRKGMLHKQLGLPVGPGLADVLQQPQDLDKVIQSNCLPNFTFISRGNPQGHAGDLLLGSRFDQLLLQLRQRFDYVLIDSSPIFAADDATTLAPKTDGTLFVVRRRFSRAGPVREALDLLYQRNARVLGVIFNQADVSSHSYYYYNHPEYATATAEPSQAG